MPRVSVIIPAFNAAEHLEQALRSVQEQTYGDWEIVVCDDCSTDGTGELARGFGDRVTVVRTEANSGPAAARNLAIQHSRGELLAFLDADDYWLPAYLERKVSLYDSGENVGIVACNAALLQDGRLLPETYMDIVHFPHEVTLRRVLRANPFLSVLTSRRAVDEVGGFCPELIRAQDFDLWIRILEAGYRTVATRDVLAVRRVHTESWSNDVQVMAHYSQQTYGRALERGNLSRGERRVAQRTIRHKRLVELIVSENAVSYRRALRALPLLLVVLAEHPRRWRLLPSRLARGRNALAPEYRYSASASQATTR
jgi:teichuronic acid biosynthesis glycosyltransferase TuaG